MANRVIDITDQIKQFFSASGAGGRTLNTARYFPESLAETAHPVLTEMVRQSLLEPVRVGADLADATRVLVGGQTRGGMTTAGKFNVPFLGETQSRVSRARELVTQGTGSPLETAGAILQTGGQATLGVLGVGGLFAKAAGQPFFEQQINLPQRDQRGFVKNPLVAEEKPLFVDKPTGEASRETPEGIKETLKTTPQTYDAVAKDPTIKAKVYDKAGNYQPDVLKEAVDDYAQKLDLHRPGLGDQFRAKITAKTYKPDELLKMATDMVDNAAMQVTRVTSAEELEGIKKMNPTLFKRAQKANTADEFIDAVVKADKTTRENVSTEALTDFFNKVKGGTAAQVTGSINIPKELQPLASEAQKYGSADEFADAHQIALRKGEAPVSDDVLRANFLNSKRQLTDFYNQATASNVVDDATIITPSVENDARFFIRDDIPLQRKTVNINDLIVDELKPGETSGYLPQDAVNKPVIAGKVGDKYYILDGKHRVDALKKAGAKTVDVVFGNTGTNPTATGLDPLLTEAKKYKTAAEYVKAQKSNPNIVWHETSKENASAIAKNGFSTGEKLNKGEITNAVYASQKGQGSSYVPEGSTKAKVGIDISKMNLLDVGKLEKKAGLPSYEQPSFKAIDNAEKGIFPDGYDGIIRRNKDGSIYEVAIKSEVATKSQLTDIWESANQGVKAVSAVLREGQTPLLPTAKKLFGDIDKKTMYGLGALLPRQLFIKPKK